MNPSTARFVMWILALALIGSGAWMIHPAAALVTVGGIVWAQVTINEVIDIYMRNVQPVPKQASKGPRHV